jgi:hypothetical protein
MEEEKMLNKIIILMLGVLLCCGGLAQAIDFYDNGAIVEGDNFDIVNVWNTATVNMTGGSVTSFLNLNNNSNFNASGGEIQNHVSTFDYSSIVFSGGNSHISLTTNDYSTIFIYDGLLTASIAAFDSSALNVYGYGFNVTPTGDSYNLTGYFQDGTSFCYYLRGSTTYPRVTLHTVPEPASAAILLFGILALRAKKLAA